MKLINKLSEIVSTSQLNKARSLLWIFFVLVTTSTTTTSISCYQSTLIPPPFHPFKHYSGLSEAEGQALLDLVKKCCKFHTPDEPDLELPRFATIKAVAVQNMSMLISQTEKDQKGNPEKESSIHQLEFPLDTKIFGEVDADGKS